MIQGIIKDIEGITMNLDTIKIKILQFTDSQSIWRSVDSLDVATPTINVNFNLFHEANKGFFLGTLAMYRQRFFPNSAIEINEASAYPLQFHCTSRIAIQPPSVHSV